MPPKSSSVLSSLLKRKGPPFSSNSDVPIAGNQARPQRETKNVALQKKVWMSDAPKATKRALESEPNRNSKAAKKAKPNGKANASAIQKSVVPDDSDDDENCNTDIEDESEGGRGLGKDPASDEELDEEEDEYCIKDSEVLAEKAISTNRTSEAAKAKHTWSSHKEPSDDDEDFAILPLVESGNISDSPSSVLDLSMLPDEGEDNDEGQLPKKSTKTFARDSKYQSEKPIMAPTSPFVQTKKMHGLKKSILASDDPNRGWAAESYLVYPDGSKMQRTISLRLQPKAIQDIVHEAILLASGLAIFEEAFPTSDQQLTQSFCSLISAAGSLNQPLISNRIEKDDIFSRHLTNYVTGRVGKLRITVKKAAVDVVASLYGLLQVPADDEEKSRKKFVKALLTKMNFVFPRNNLVDATSIRLNEPYRHPAIITVLHKVFFKGAKSYGQHFINTFTSSSSTDDMKEIPSAMLTLVIVGIFAALKEWEEGEDQREEQDFASATFADVVGLHNALLIDKIRDAKVGNGAGKYHTLMARLYRDAKVGKGISVALDQVPDVDLEGME
ncbi:hypothetical protein DFJ43DRAFT_1037796 [Lentinula guzmanii]|uniref:DUF6532 domain-containing protein n=1 Tax=Lentinula guzmanii TaxID=2804957 RepID=A0AA38N222_9AGAR|nr:hypothetical protein DFJ43DRAFT_1037796 [Lentinula guzmanii]